MLKKVALLVCIVLSLIISPRGALAENEFAASYDVNYSVGNDGVTIVTQKITLKNLTSQYYASNFTLTISSTNISDISATDDSGPMEVKTETKADKTTMNIKFNQQVAGIDKSQTFTLKFRSTDFATKNGKTWEVDLPRIPDSSNINNYNLILQVPASFGEPTSIAPGPKSQTLGYDTLSFTFNKELLGKSGVSLNFGTTQVFDFNLKYHLENNSLIPVMTSVVLPPDTKYQDILISRISPEPLNVTIDDDGNYLAWYQLSRRSKQNVNISGSAKLYIKAKEKQVETLTSAQKSMFTKTDQYWEKDNPGVLAAIAEVFKEGTPKSNRDKARLIYSYIVNTLKYNTSRLNDQGIERLGAVTALNNRDQAVCMEFTDLFVAMTRASGVPSRELDGFGYSQNRNLRPLSLSKNLLHAWPEYFDEQKGWVMVDPTWENTSGGVDYFNKFDLNHLVLAIKGVSSKTPYTSDDVNVTLSEDDFLGKPNLDISVSIPEEVWSGFPITASVKLVNQGNSIQQGGSLSVNTNRIKVLGQKEVGFAAIPPFGYFSYKFNLRTPNFWESFEDTIEVDVMGQKFTKKVVIKPFLFYSPVSYIAGGIIVLILGIYFAILGVHIYQKKAKQVEK